MFSDCELKSNDYDHSCVVNKQHIMDCYHGLLAWLRDLKGSELIECVKTASLQSCQDLDERMQTSLLYYPDTCVKGEQ